MFHVKDAPQTPASFFLISMRKALKINISSFRRIPQVNAQQIKEQTVELTTPMEKVGSASHGSSEDDSESDSDTIRALSSYFPGNISEGDSRPMYVLNCTCIPDYTLITSLRGYSYGSCHRCKMLKVWIFSPKLRLFD